MVSKKPKSLSKLVLQHSNIVTVNKRNEVVGNGKLVPKLTLMRLHVPLLMNLALLVSMSLWMLLERSRHLWVSYQILPIHKHWLIYVRYFLNLNQVFLLPYPAPPPFHLLISESMTCKPDIFAIDHFLFQHWAYRIDTVKYTSIMPGDIIFSEER